MGLYIAGLLLGGLLTILSLIMGILALAGGKNRNAIIWAISLLVALSILITCVIQVAWGVGAKVADSVALINELQKKRSEKNSSPPADTKLSERQAFIDTLKSHINEQYEGKYPAAFYSDAEADTAEDGTIILPFLYPYSIKYRPDEFLGDIITREDNKVYASNINQLAFDKNFVIAKVDNTNDQKALKSGHPEIEYILFDMRTGEYTDFPNQKQLIEMSSKIGYTGPELMNYLSDDYSGWIGDPEY